MCRSRPLSYVLALLAVFPAVRVAAEESTSATPAVAVAIEDFSYRDTSGEPADQTAVHRKRLEAFMAALRRDVETDPHYRIVEPGHDGEKLRIVGAIQKMSTLVQWAKAAVIDVGAKKATMDKLYTFRGDSDEAWERAEAFLSREIQAALATSQSAPIALAVFDFELDDTSAAAAASGLPPADAAKLAEVTESVRERLGQSGRYRLIDVSAAADDAVKTHRLRDCGGCDAAIAEGLGADQSLIGVVRRVSRTEYSIGFQVRDARTGAVISRGDSGLRMGADYSWKRGAVRLVGDRLVDGESRQ